MGFSKHSSAFFWCDFTVVVSISPHSSAQVFAIDSWRNYLWLLKNWSVHTHCFDWRPLLLYFLLFNPYPFLLLSSSVMSNNCGKSSLFSAINTASSAYLMLLTLCPPILIPGYPSMLLKSFHCRERKGLEQAHILVRHRTLFFFFFFNELIYPSTHIVAVWYHFMFYF